MRGERRLPTDALCIPFLNQIFRLDCLYLHAIVALHLKTYQIFISESDVKGKNLNTS